MAVVYKDNTGKDAVMWVLEKDGVRVQNTKLQKYIEQTGRYQDAEKYTIITLADLDKKITKAWQKGTYYMNGKVYSGGTGKVLQASAYVQEWKGKLDESGLTDVVLGLGLSTAAIRYKEIKVDKQLITVSKYADFSSYKYNSTTNPGPLSKLENTPSKNFYGGRYNVEVLSEPRMLYRAGDAKNPFGQWFTESAPQSVATVRIDSAVKAQWLTKEGYWDNSYSNINT
ncbi:hypothetical protein HB769_14975, partial [Listeria welshimeri]|nr:hypothetical protein [Listeria welshimeri]